MNLLLAAMLSLVLPATASTQTTTATKPEQKPTTIVGCLVDNIPFDADGQPVAASAAAQTKGFFVRTPTVMLPSGSTVAVGTVGTTSTVTSSGTPTSDSYYRITGLDAAQLRPHVGHRIEVHGHLTPSSTAEGDHPSSVRTIVDPSGKPERTVATPIHLAGELHATHVKMVSADCRVPQK
jgi:hypothetical protein